MEIYEGDVILYPWARGEKVEMVCEFETGGIFFSPTKEEVDVWQIYACQPDGVKEGFEVIGNIHDKEK